MSNSSVFQSSVYRLSVSAVAGMLALWASSANAETLRLAHASSSKSLIQEAVVMFADKVAKETKDGLTVQIFPDGQLGDEGPIADGVGSGSIDVGLGGVADAIDPKLNVVTLPFLFSDAKAAHAFLDGPVGMKVFDTGADNGFKMLGALDSGFRQFATVSKTIATPEDMKGLKLRTPPNPVILTTIEQLGALPQSLPFGEVYTSLQSHVVDGVEPEIRDFADQKWYESAKFLSVSNYIWTPNYWFMNKERFDRLSTENQAAVLKAADETTIWYRGKLDEVYAKVIEELKSKGVTVTTVDTAPFRAMVDPVYAKFGAEWGDELVTSVRTAAAAK
ncbi:TRAP transporter substrate-binding protein [Rhizobium leguminosarum]|uniref:TRAP transporter substrate-binding protein n=1 Tax=Rhizobium leguminosarum TaxID=384 RepID=A0AAJ1AC21_RHILE|nr:TRAP transporter substrate-binding protein [Rhizobium leguminosarum]MBY5533733.1 TRAP transporter substrate-binding protein [Rhizobium leguminosarum]MBY5594821.1 TRAP transporter substrate-binding protein [Rhizobium leguminosarum]MBY5630846.1 TRAP transporter substrate-binding protein [Rhizobium leguminosarum]